ncbi:MAG: hypothetical protein KKE86_06285 [Planctomycetes bacterium]|nr:hypothetical protein [Planctomycetota bacterium]MCG2683895.1 hypothetical protein [Planctomycetales bacterium]
MARTTSARIRAAGALALACLAMTGCGQQGLHAKAMHGSVTCGGEKVPLGQVSFVPIEGTPGPTTTALIVDGRYRVERGGGVPLGKHRVEVDVRKKTGRKVKGFNGLEPAMIDEVIRVGPEVYAGGQSPLVVEVRSDSDGQFDITLPSGKGKP